MHQIKSRIRIRNKTYKLELEPDPDKHHFTDNQPKFMEFGHIFFNGLSIFWKQGSGSESASDT
jgi:hypothetical protein